MQHSCVLILPIALKPAGDLIGAAMGWGPESYTIPLSADGVTVTHVGLRADCDSQFMAWLKGAEPLPPIEGAEPEKITAVLSALIASFSPDPDDPNAPVLWGSGHLVRVCEAYGLVATQ